MTTCTWIFVGVVGYVLSNALFVFAVAKVRRALDKRGQYIKRPSWPNEEER